VGKPTTDKKSVLLAQVKSCQYLLFQFNLPIEEKKPNHGDKDGLKIIEWVCYRNSSVFAGDATLRRIMVGTPAVYGLEVVFCAKASEYLYRYTTQ